MVTDRPETIQLQTEKPTTDGNENFSLCSANEATSGTPKQPPEYNGYTPVEKVNPLPSDTSER
jgi:hypothetical protein